MAGNIPEFKFSTKARRIGSQQMLYFVSDILIDPGEFCYVVDPRRQPERNHLRMTFGTVDEQAIEESVARLTRAIKRVAAGKAPAVGTARARRPSAGNVAAGGPA